MEKAFRIDGIDCANCAAKIERALSKLSNVEKVNINFMTGKMESMLDILKRICYFQNVKFTFLLEVKK